MIEINGGMKAFRAGACLLAAVFALGAPLSGLQENEPAASDTVAVTEFPSGVASLDRIVAVVGDTAILMSDIQVTLYQLQARGARVPLEGTEGWETFAREVLDAMIDDLIYLQEARNAGITVPEGRVTEMADAYFAETRANFSSDEEMMLAVEETGMNMLQFRQMQRSQAQAEGMRQAYRIELEQRDDLPPVIVSEEEVEAAFEEFAQNQPPRPALVSFNRLVVTPNPSGDARDSVLARTIRVQNDFANDEEFSVLARRHSDDDGTREQGGELGWMNRELLVKPFGDAAWGARPGQTVGPVQTQFGLHFIKIERQRGAERFLRHILLRPEITEEDIEEARTLAIQVADSLRAGTDPERLVALFRGRVADEAIRFDDVSLASLVSQFTGAGAESGLTAPTPGTVYGPLPMERGGPTEFGLVHVLQFRPEGPIELNDVRDQIRQSLRTRKQIDIILQEVRSNTYIDVRF
ncbi:MAG: peptidylprolyl isomerase [Gemmatimonadota bacterium]|uniref:peptidylprolyl isomerase n=1 Tax=Candidatus Palauibacter scopulicola TaxID=3056741 RepID=UPI00239B085E|nr:peptidylprolyl isomerase [Candidatus Palauibacter scopulicola]MDE2664438.1 peptidylprolyl isomerase [Candidatus Palauibacter scopulicola]